MTASSERSFEIREARASDASGLSALVAELGYPAPASVIATRLDTLLACGEVVLVAVRDREPIGVLTVHVTPVLHRPTSVGRITMLVVSERERGTGIGRALVHAAEELLTARGCALVEVTSNQKRTDAHAFYERLGYEVTSVRFKKDLAPS